jgi:hypothetical protein
VHDRHTGGPGGATKPRNVRYGDPMRFVRQLAQHGGFADHAVLALLRDEHGVRRRDQFLKIHALSRSWRRFVI